MAFSSLAPASTDPRDKSLVIREVVPGIVTFSIPFTRIGFLPIGGRSTAIRLTSGIFVYVSHPFTSATDAAIKELGGEVKWLVTPDGEHGMNIEAWSKAFPQAKAIGVKRHGAAKPGVTWAGLFGEGGEDKQYGFEPEISLHQVSAHKNHELIAIHHPTGTLLEADMLFNLPPTEQYSRHGGIPYWFRLLGSGSTFSPGGSAHRSLPNSLVSDHGLLKSELAPIVAAKWDRIIPCHGNVIENNGRVAWDKVWGKFA